jgi:hypothetical protein
MTAPRDLDRQLEAFLTDGPTDLPDPSYDALRDRIESTHQRVVIGPWRMPDMNKLAPVLLGAAVVLVALVASARLFPREGGIAAPSVAPSATMPASGAPSPTPPSFTSDPLLAVGRHLLLPAPTVEVTIPAPGWYEWAQGILMNDDTAEAPGGAGLIIFHEQRDGELVVYGDPCAWSTTIPNEPSTTVDSFIAALTAQESREASTPRDIVVDGHAGKSITMRVSDEADFSECDSGVFGSWSAGLDSTPSRYHQFPGQIDEVWAVDVSGDLVVIDWWYYEGTPQSVIDDLRVIAASTVFE